MTSPRIKKLLDEVASMSDAEVAKVNREVIQEIADINGWLRDEIAKLQDKLDDYGQHSEGCEYLNHDRRFAKPSSCDCGLFEKEQK